MCLSVSSDKEKRQESVADPELPRGAPTTENGAAKLLFGNFFCRKTI